MIARMAGRTGNRAGRQRAGVLLGGEYRIALGISLLVHAALLLGLSLGEGRGSPGAERERARTLLMRVHFVPEGSVAAPATATPAAARPANARTARTADNARGPAEVLASIHVTVPVEPPVDSAGSQETSERPDLAPPSTPSVSMPPAAEPVPAPVEAPPAPATARESGEPPSPVAAAEPVQTMTKPLSPESPGGIAQGAPARTDEQIPVAAVTSGDGQGRGAASEHSGADGSAGHSGAALAPSGKGGEAPGFAGEPAPGALSGGRSGEGGVVDAGSGTETPAPQDLAAVRSRIDSRKVYPPIAIRNGWEGRVLVEMRLEGDGRLAAVRLLQGSGYAVLDEATLRAVRLASPFPPVARVVTVPVEYRLIP